MSEADNREPIEQRHWRLVMARFYFAACVAFIAWSFAAGLGIPIWRDGWWLGVIGDRSDIAVCSFIAAWLLYAALSPSPRPDEREIAP